MDLSHVREQYETTGLDEADVDPDPIVQFQRWYRDAEAADLWEPNAMVVSAVDADGWPTSRFVLLKSVDDGGFTFYTNYGSAKADALDAAGRATLTFGWLPLRRQVRIQGRVERVSRSKSPTPTLRNAPGGANSGRGRRHRAASSQDEASSIAATTRSPLASVTTRSRGPTTGAGIGWCRPRSSSGRADPIGSTTAWCSPGCPTAASMVHEWLPRPGR